MRLCIIEEAARKVATVYRAFAPAAQPNQGSRASRRIWRASSRASRISSSRCALRVPARRALYLIRVAFFCFVWKPEKLGRSAERGSAGAAGAVVEGGSDWVRAGSYLGR